MGKWIALVPAAEAAADDPDTAATMAASRMVEPLAVNAIYVAKVADVRVYEVGVYQVGGA